MRVSVVIVVVVVAVVVTNVVVVRVGIGAGIMSSARSSIVSKTVKPSSSLEVREAVEEDGGK